MSLLYCDHRFSRENHSRLVCYVYIQHMCGYIQGNAWFVICFLGFSYHYDHHWYCYHYIKNKYDHQDQNDYYDQFIFHQ